MLTGTPDETTKVDFSSPIIILSSFPHFLSQLALGLLVKLLKLPATSFFVSKSELTKE